MYIVYKAFILLFVSLHVDDSGAPRQKERKVGVELNICLGLMEQRVEGMKMTKKSLTGA